MPFNAPSDAVFNAVVYRIHCGRFFGDEGEVDDGDVRGWDADREAVELTGHLGNDELEGLGGAGGTGDHVDGGGAGAAEVLVREVEDDLIVGVAVDRGHDAGDDAEALVQHLDDGREAVRRAGGVRDDVVLRCVVLVFVDAEDDGDVLVGGRRGDDDFLDRSPKVGLGFGGVGEDPGRFDDDFYALRGPVELRRVAFRVDLDLFAVDRDVIFACDDVVLQVAENRVVLEQVGEGCRAGEVVHGDDVQFSVAESGAENIASNATKTVDANLNCH